MTMKFKPQRHPLPSLLASSLIALSLGIQSRNVMSSENQIGEPVASGNPVQDAVPQEREPEQDLLDEIVITGSKVNLMDAQFMKRNADTMVDAISADQIGLLPDRSTLDAMQRLPGVAIERFASPNDPDHFGVEGADIILRGMKQTRSEFNGRDTFSAYSGRGLSYRDVPPELLGSIQVFKNQTADMVEGGIGGTVNLITRKPFDSDEPIVAFSADVSYGDLAKESSPSFSALYSNSFDTELGRLGFLLNLVSSELVGESHGIQSETYVQFYASEFASEDDTGPVGQRAIDFLGEDGKGKIWAPNGSNMLMKTDERKRDGYAGAFQYASPDGRVEAVLEVIHSDSVLAWNERAIKYQGGFFTENNRPTAPLEGTHFLLDENGLFLSGILVEEGNPWRVGPTGTDRIPSTNGLSGYRQFGHKTQMDSRVNETRSSIDDVSLNVKFNVNEQLTLEGDLQLAYAEAEVDDLAVHLYTWAMFDYDVRGDIPSLKILEPWLGERDADAAASDAIGEKSPWEALENGVAVWPGFGLDDKGDTNYFQDEHSYLWGSAMDHYERSQGDSLASRIDVDYRFDNESAFSGIKFGYRFSEREQIVRSTSWNWGALAPSWNGDSTSNWDLPEGEYQGTGIGWLDEVTPQQDGYEWVDWSNFMRGGVATIPGSQTIHASEALIRSAMGANADRQLYYSAVRSGNWTPYPQREGVDSRFGIFLPDEINTTLETKNAFYVRLDFEGKGDVTFSGNVGLRYMKMEREAAGVVDFPVIAPIERKTQRFPQDDVTLPLTAEVVDAYLNQQVADGLYESYNIATTAADNNWIHNPYFYLSNEVRGFTEGLPLLDENGEFATLYPEYIHFTNGLVAKDDYDVWLPSFNIKMDLTPELVGRIAFAKSVAFPDMADVRNRTEFAPMQATSERSDDLEITYRTVEVEGNAPDLELIDEVRLNRRDGDAVFLGEGGNPFMKPMESVQYDFSLEWYFSDFGQLSAAVFHKNLSNYFSRGVITRSFTNELSGVSQNVAVTSNRNGGDAKLDGVELNYHQFFEGFFEGFGVQATYTFIDANSVPNNEKNVEDEQWYDSVYEDTGVRVNPDKLPLQGQSDHIVNLIGLYETEVWSARLAYNWRSKYLLTTRDVISKAPLWYHDHGELDGSLFYSINDNFSIGIQGKNLTNEKTKLSMILNDDLLSTGRTWFVGDRRFSLVLRGEF